MRKRLPPANAGSTRFAPLTARTLVEQVVEAIVAAAAQGHFLPGDRIVEAEVARELAVSRVPVREALRLLESQGIVVNEPYRGMRLMDVSMARLEKILKVRLALETLAVQDVRAALAADPDATASLDGIVRRMHAAAKRGDRLGVAHCDTEFHHTLCELSGNDVLVRTWETLSRQLTIIFGLSTLQKKPVEIAAEHDELLAALRGKGSDRIDRLMEIHILEHSRALDYEGFGTRLRRRGPGLRTA